YGGAAPLSEHRTLEAGGAVVVTFDIPAAGSSASTSASAPATSASPGTFPFKPAAVASFATGAASFIAMGVLVGVRADALAAIDRTCPAHQGCPDSLRDERDRGELASTLVNVFAV